MEMRHGARTGRPVAAATRTEWVCPMHPEIVRDAPGKLPEVRNGPEPRTAAGRREEMPNSST